MADAGKLSVRAKADMQAVIAGSGVQDVIACSDVMGLLSCQTTKARQVLKMMEDTGLIKTVRVRGKASISWRCRSFLQRIKQLQRIKFD